MSFEIDPRFKASSKDAQRRARVRLIRMLSIVVGSVFALFAVGMIAWVLLFTDAVPDDPITIEIAEDNTDADSGESTQLAMVADTERPIFDARATFIDLAKDPLILTFAPSENSTVNRTRRAPEALDPLRVGTIAPDQLTMIEDALVVRSRRLTTTLPSSRADFAYFQTARSDAMALLEPEIEDEHEPAEDAQGGELITVDGDDGSWGALISSTQDTAATDEATYIETTIANTTSIVHSVRDTDRYTIFHDEIIVTQTERPLLDVLKESGLDRVQALLTERAAIRLLQVRDTLDPGIVLAARIQTDPKGTSLLQLSLYSGADYIGSLAQVSPGNFETSADPWLNENLLDRSREAASDAVLLQDIRLLDGIYSAAIRNGMPSSLVGEMMVMLSQNEDLERFASSEDEFVAVFSSTPGITGQGAGQLLYAGVHGPSGDIECYVVLAPSRENFECYHERVAANQMGGIGAGLLVPVNGTKTSSFGPRMHPVLGQMRAHNGVDWGAPTGTPVIAAADGTITRASVNGGYGNVIYIDHSGNRQTRYAHLNAYADGIRSGVAVSAGDVIGYVGTTGRSTGPHLHFELRVGDQPVDPLTYTGPPNVVVATTTASAAVEALVNQIITVESANNANAANPNSTARGLGQFIESTWLRMMDVYRPDLAGLSRADKLNLRFDPDLSREMVRNLAREGESYLRNRGHQITAGRLYLAHFLGASGAHIALSADANASVASVMGQGVVNANGFLRGRNMAWLWNWAERKMVPSGSAPTPTVAAPESVAEPRSEETIAFIEAIDSILEEL